MKKPIKEQRRNVSTRQAVERAIDATKYAKSRRWEGAGPSEEKPTYWGRPPKKKKVAASN